MHDPMTVAFSVPSPFARRYSWASRWRDRPSLATIWHVDPESDGSDDSCGWFSPHLTKEKRPRWKHPRWHVHHWRIQIDVVEAFKRWSFTRCSECGGRFQWGASGVGGWHSDGPRWFASENLTHMDCADDRVKKDPTHEDAIDAMGEEEKP